MRVQVQHAVRKRDGHLESTRSGDADDGEGAEVDSALPRRRHLVADRGLLDGFGLPGLLSLGPSLGLLLDLDLERAKLVVPSKEAVVLRRGGEGGWSCFELGGRSPSKTQGLGLGL